MKRIIGLIFAISLCASQANAITLESNGKKMNVPVCGGFLGLSCNSNQWCDYPASATCGGADNFGVCRPRPEVCNKIYQPVCGCDAKTYSNACMAAAAGSDVAYLGSCRSISK